MQGSHDTTRKKFFGAYLKRPLALLLHELAVAEHSGSDARLLEWMGLEILRAKKMLTGDDHLYTLRRLFTVNHQKDIKKYERRQQRNGSSRKSVRALRTAN